MTAEIDMFSVFAETLSVMKQMCNVIRKTVPQLWVSRSIWLFANCDKTRRTDSWLEVDDRSRLRDGMSAMWFNWSDGYRNTVPLRARQFKLNS